MKYDLIVIGAGPAGYVGAIRAAQLGKKVICIDRDRAGGTCLNWGCIPTKSLLKNAELYHLMSHRAKEFGLRFDNLTYEWGDVIGRSRKVAGRLAGGIEFLFKKNKVDYVVGEAAMSAAGKVNVTDKDGKQQTIEGDRILIATGCVSREFPGLPFNGTTVIGSKEAMVLEKQPGEIVIIGAGAIGIEFAYFFNAFGTKVTVIEMMDHILPVEDTEVSIALEKSLKKSGIRLLTKTRTVGTKDNGDGVEIIVEGAVNETLKAECALIAIGVAPVLPSGLEVDLDRGFITTDDNYQTSLKNVYAVGDIIGQPWLAHVASWEALQCVGGLYEGHTPKKVGVFPGCTYCQPQVASVGITERMAKEKGLRYRIGTFPFQASGKALAVGESEGFVKLIFGDPHGELLGAHIIGSEATEMIAELGLAITGELTAEDIEATIHAHPTFSEAVREATDEAYGKVIHI